MAFHVCLHMEHSGSVGRALDWNSKYCQFETHHCSSHCVVSLSKTFSCLVLVQPRKTGNCPIMTEKILT